MTGKLLPFERPAPLEPEPPVQEDYSDDFHALVVQIDTDELARAIVRETGWNAYFAAENSILKKRCPKRAIEAQKTGLLKG